MIGSFEAGVIWPWAPPQSLARYRPEEFVNNFSHTSVNTKLSNMDPVSVVGLAGALIGIADVLSRSIGGLISLQSKYRSSSLVVSLLIGQLTTLKAALGQVQKWLLVA